MINDSGNRTEFDTGAVRDIQEGKGRFDLMPLDVVGDLMMDGIVQCVYDFTRTNDVGELMNAIRYFCDIWYTTRTDDADDLESGGDTALAEMMLELAKHFEEGAKKYGEHNWEKGIPVNRYLDSAMRHYMKWTAGWQDEPHDRAFVWNIMCCIWTVKHDKVPKEDPLDIY